MVELQILPFSLPRPGPAAILGRRGVIR